MILIDPPVWPARGRVWSHVASDTSYEELHAFAAHAGLHPRSYDGDHYDVPGERYDDVVAAGASPTSARDILARVEVAGLRFRKRRGERPLAALPNGLPALTAAHRLDLLASDREPPHETTVAAVTLVSDRAGRVLLVDAPHRGSWEAPGGWREPGETPRAGAAREVAEETGLLLHETALEPCAYERILLVDAADPGAGRLMPTSHIAIYRARTDATIDSPGPQGRRLLWASPEELTTRCHRAPWLPVIQAVFEI